MREENTSCGTASPREIYGARKLVYGDLAGAVRGFRPPLREISGATRVERASSVRHCVVSEAEVVQRFAVGSASPLSTVHAASCARVEKPSLASADAT